MNIPRPNDIDSTLSSRKLSIAPMMEYTDRHCRYLLRLISKRTLLYTEMVTTGALLNGDKHYLLDFDACEHPLALQLGGSNPQHLAECCRIAEGWGYDEINLNIGCPSDRVRDGAFGACLMAHPQLVADCIDAMQQATRLPVTVKCRIGIDDQDSYEELAHFIETVAKTGCRTFILHARKAVLGGLTPKQNRDIPPLNYQRVYRIKDEHPHLEIIINGGIVSLDQASEHLKQVDGVMIGREAYHNPYMLAAADQVIFGDLHDIPCRDQIFEHFCEYVSEKQRTGTRLNHMAKHLFGLYSGIPGARRYRRHLSEQIHHRSADVHVLREAANFIFRD